MNVVWFSIGLFLGVTLGWLLKVHAEKKEENSLEDTWRKLLNEVGERLQPGQSIALSTIVSKESNNEEDEPVDVSQNFRWN